MKCLESFILQLNETIECAMNEYYKIDDGNFSRWDKELLNKVVFPEMNELLAYALKGKGFFKYGKKQRLLESTYLITDSINGLNDTPLGEKIIELQKIYNSL